MKRFEEIRDLVLALEGDFAKFYDKKNQAAGTRVRVAMQKIKGLAQDVRVDISERKKA